MNTKKRPDDLKNNPDFFPLPSQVWGEEKSLILAK